MLSRRGRGGSRVLSGSALKETYPRQRTLLVLCDDRRDINGGWRWSLWRGYRRKVLTVEVEQIGQGLAKLLRSLVLGGLREGPLGGPSIARERPATTTPSRAGQGRVEADRACTG